MAGNAFTKKYLKELIQKRIDQIENPDDKLDEETERLRRLERAAAREKLTNAYAQMRPALKHARKLLEEPGDEASVDAMEAAFNQLYRGASTTDKFYHEIVRQKQVISNILTARPKPAERERLTSVLAYVDESPDDEFSVTLMQRLGFIDIIKKAING